MTLDEWYELWRSTCKKNCRDTTSDNYANAYNRIRESLGWRKMSSINLIIMQQAFNELKTDCSRKDTRKVLIDIYNKAIDADIILKNIPMQVNPIVANDHNPEEPRVLTLEETEWFLEEAEHYRYYNPFCFALETGLRIGEILALKWSDIDFDNQIIHVRRTLVYVKCRDETNPNYGKMINAFHEPKTDKGKRKIPMTLRAYQILKRQKVWKEELLEKANGNKALEGFEDLVFVTTRNTPIRQTDTDLVMQLISKRIEEKHEGFKPLTPHTLRHTFATRCIERGMNPKTLQVIMGHSSVNITMNLYCHVTEDTLFTEMEKFETGSQNDTNVPNGVKVV